MNTTTTETNTERTQNNSTWKTIGSIAVLLLSAPILGALVSLSFPTPPWDQPQQWNTTQKFIAIFGVVDCSLAGLTSAYHGWQKTLDDKPWSIPFMLLGCALTIIGAGLGVSVFKLL